MAERRSLGEALSLTPEKVHFIKSDKNGTFRSPESETVATAALSPDPVPQAPPLEQPPQRQQRVEATRDHQGDNLYTPSLVSVTTRLQQDTATALRRAYLEQKLSRRLPDTQQEIIEEALQHWLYERGFLR